MSPHPRMTAAQYIAHFKPNEPYEDGDQELSDAKSRVGDTSMENPAMGWTMKLHIMVPKVDVFFHDVLTRTLGSYAGVSLQGVQSSNDELLLGD
jgi:hypothetical protein